MRASSNTANRSVKACLGIGVIGVLALGAVAAILGYFYYFGSIPWKNIVEPLTGPAVTIQEPSPGTQMTKGDSFVFFATANDEAGVVRLDLWIDSTLVLSQSSPEVNGINPLSLSFPLVAVENGTYALIARAYNSQGEFGESVVHYVTVIEPTASTQEYAQYIVQEGDTLENIAARLGVSVDSILQANPHIQGGQVVPGQVILIPLGPRQPAQAAVPGPNGIQPVSVPGGQQPGPAQQPPPPNPPPPANQPSLAIKGHGVLTSPVFYGQSCTTEPLTTDTVATIEPPSAVKTATLKYAYYGKAGSSPVLTVPMVSTGGSNFGANINAGGEAAQYLAQEGGAAVVWVEVTDTNAKTSISQSVTLIVNYCPNAVGPNANLPGILPQFMPGGGDVQQLDPSLFPSPGNIVFNPPVNLPDPIVTAPGDLKASARPDKCEIKLTWTDSHNETSYRIDRYVFGQPNPNTVSSRAADQTNYTESLPQPGKYGYRVSAERKAGGKYSQAPSTIVWVELLSSEKCKSLPEFKRFFFRPVFFKPLTSSHTQAFVQVTIGDLPTIRVPAGEQIPFTAGDLSNQYLEFSAPAPEQIYNKPGASLNVQVHADGSAPNQPPVDLGQFAASHSMMDLTAPGSKNQNWVGKGNGFELAYKLWIEDWLWDGKATSAQLPPPYNLKLETSSDQRRLSWSYDPAIQGKQVSGFIIYRDYICPGNNERVLYPLVAGKGRAGSSGGVISMAIPNEPAGCACFFEVSAFGSDGESKRSGIQPEECKTRAPVDEVYATFESLKIAAGVIPQPISGEIHLLGNAFTLRSYAVPLEEKTYDLKGIPFNGIQDGNSLHLPIGAGDSSSVILNFSVSNLCMGQALQIRKQSATWEDVTGNYTLSAKDQSGNVICEVDVKLWADKPMAGAPNPATKTDGTACITNAECNSGNCIGGRCAPRSKGNANAFCFANSQCYSGTCQCTVGGKLVPCSPVPQANTSGFCATGTKNGWGCTRNSECASNYCANGFCAPKNGLGQRGDSCHHDNHCANGFCMCPRGWEGGFCKGHNKWFDAEGVCAAWPGNPNGYTCGADQDCSSRHCAEYKCAPRDYTGLSGEYCHHDNHCYSKVCQCTKVQGGGLGGGSCPGYQDFTPANHPICAP